MKVFFPLRKTFKTRGLFQLLFFLLNLGSKKASQEDQIRIRITNLISITFLLGIVIFTTMQLILFCTTEIEFLFSFGLLNLMILGLNRLGYIGLTKILHIIIINLSVFVIVQKEKDLPAIVVYQLLAAFLPFLLFRLSQIKYIILSIIFNFALVILSSPYLFSWLTPNIHTQKQIIYETAFALWNSYVCSICFLLYFYLQNEKMKKRVTAQTLRTKNLNAQLTELLEEQKLTTQIIAHDLRNPLSSILGIESILNPILEKNKTIPQEIPKFLGLIFKSASNGIRVIEDIRDAYSFEQKGVTIEIESLPIEEILSEISVSFQTMLEEKQVRIILSCPTGLRIRTNRLRLTRAIENALTNAIKFSPEKGEIQINVFAKDYIDITIKDSGIGIPKKLHRFLFQKFTQAKRRGLHNEVSTGLGMYIIHKIMISLGGAVTIDSIENRGTSISLLLPLSKME
ncbi:MAG: HAMP domain-containing histidine kinase [Leptospiraceae bacterium]|nr:HAMP domain-containing histidine kinase [Leptospiraceae bacterium]